MRVNDPYPKAYLSLKHFAVIFLQHLYIVKICSQLFFWNILIIVKISSGFTIGIHY